MRNAGRIVVQCSYNKFIASVQAVRRGLFQQGELMKRLLLLVAVMLLIASLGVLPASAQSSLPAGPVYDNGPSWHARGTVSGNVYTVAFGDTMFSISRRFGLTVDGLAAANGITNTSLIFGGQSLTIPGLGPGPTPGPTSNITISTPTAGALLPASFTVSGNASGPSGANVVVQALLTPARCWRSRSPRLGLKTPRPEACAYGRSN